MRIAALSEEMDKATSMGGAVDWYATAVVGLETLYTRFGER